MVSGAREWLAKAPNPKLVLLYGLGAGLACFPVNLISRMVCTGCCPYRGILGGAPLLLLPFLAGLLVALFADWRVIPYDAAVRVGVDIGLRTGVVAAVCGLAVIAATELLALLLTAAQAGASVGLERAVAQSELQMAVPAAFYTMVIASLFAVVGVGLGVLGGSLGAAIKRSPSV
jgi:hypothetical protein